MEISITIEAMFGLNWDLWKRIVAQVQRIGFDGLYRSDHLIIGVAGSDSLELITSLTYLAEHSHQIHFGSLVAPLSVHNPVMLARQAMAINDLAGGRMILGVGAGWHEEEHTMFGFPLGDPMTRLDRFEEGLKVISALVREDGPVDFDGRYFHLSQAQLVPQSPVRILVGGNGPKRTLPLVARYADVWNCQLADAAAFKVVNSRLDELIIAAGRPPANVKRTVMVPALAYRSPADLQRHLDLLRRDAAAFRSASDEEIHAWFSSLKGIFGSPQQVIDGLAAFKEHGADEMIIEWFALADEEGLEGMAEVVGGIG